MELALTKRFRISVIYCAKRTVFKSNPVKFKEIETRPKKAEKEKAIFTSRKRYTPSPDHPWRRFTYERQKNVLQQKEPTEVIT